MKDAYTSKNTINLLKNKELEKEQNMTWKCYPKLDFVVVQKTIQDTYH